MSSILVVSGKSSGFYFPLQEQSVVIGRDENADIQIVDEMVSRRHMQLRRESDGDDAAYLASDLESANGSKVNGHALSRETPLHDGDAIQLGESKLLYSKKQIRDLDTAMAYLKERGQGEKNTIIQ